MKITFDIPDSTCALVVIGLHGAIYDMTVTTRSFGTEHLKDGAKYKLITNKENENEDEDNA